MKALQEGSPSEASQPLMVSAEARLVASISRASGRGLATCQEPLALVKTVQNEEISCNSYDCNKEMKK